MEATTRLLIAVVFVASLAGLAQLLKRHRGNLLPQLRSQKGPQEIHVLDRHALTMQHTAHLLDVRGQLVLIVTHPGGATFMNAVDPVPAKTEAGISTL